MVKALLVLVYLQLLPTSVFASTEFGNGGNILVCDGFRLDYHLYDTYESQARYNMEPKFPESPDCSENGPCVDESLLLAQKIVNRLRLLDPDLSTELDTYINDFKQDMRFIPGKFLPVDDHGVAFIPIGCKLSQFAVQHEPITRDDRRYFISSELWVGANIYDKAALITHEVIYRAALSRSRVESSEGVRYFNALLFTNKISGLSKDYYKEIKSKVFQKNSE